MSIIQVDHVSKSFFIPTVRRETFREHVMDLFRSRPADKLCILNEVSFDVEQGETLGIVGRNGSGKSTLLKIVAGIFRADAGRIIVRGTVTPILELGVGWNPELDAIDNILLIGSVMGLSLRDIRAATDEILAFAEVERFANLKLKYYSSGMGSRLAYAIAFKAVREVLILDEIFAVGDASFQAKCQERYRQLHASGHTVLLVSHSDEIIREFCDRAILLEGGRVMLEDTPDRVCRVYSELLGCEIPLETAKV